MSCFSVVGAGLGAGTQLVALEDGVGSCLTTPFRIRLRKEDALGVTKRSSVKKVLATYLEL